MLYTEANNEPQVNSLYFWKRPTYLKINYSTSDLIICHLNLHANKLELEKRIWPSHVPTFSLSRAREPSILLAEARNYPKVCYPFLLTTMEPQLQTGCMSTYSTSILVRHAQAAKFQPMGMNLSDLYNFWGTPPLSYYPVWTCWKAIIDHVDEGHAWGMEGKQ